MVRKSGLTSARLKDLGAAKLAQLVLDEAERNVGFRRQVKAAIAGQAGPEAIAKLIDRRLAGLERARSFVDWDKVPTFRSDLSSYVETGASELCPAFPSSASAQPRDHLMTMTSRPL